MEPTGGSQASLLESPPNGAAWAALLASGIGGVVFGLITDASECSARVSRFLQWYRPTGALSGVAICAIVVWAVVWAVLHARWSGKQLRHQRTLTVTILILALLALLTTFPPFYELFAG